MLNYPRANIWASCLLASVMFLIPSPPSSLHKNYLPQYKMHSVRRLRLICADISPIKQIRQIHLSNMSSKPVPALIMGPPGSGKGTVSERIVNTCKVTHLSSGDVLRSQIKEGTEVGLKAKAIVEKGGLVPDEIMIELIMNKMKELAGGSWLLDGMWGANNAIIFCSGIVHMKLMNVYVHVFTQSLQRYSRDLGGVGSKSNIANGNVISWQIHLRISSEREPNFSSQLLSCF